MIYHFLNSVFPVIGVPLTRGAYFSNMLRLAHPPWAFSFAFTRKYCVSHTVRSLYQLPFPNPLPSQDPTTAGWMEDGTCPRPSVKLISCVTVLEEGSPRCGSCTCETNGSCLSKTPFSRILSYFPCTCTCTGHPPTHALTHSPTHPPTHPPTQHLCDR